MVRLSRANEAEPFLLLAYEALRDANESLHGDDGQRVLHSLIDLYVARGDEEQALRFGRALEESE